MVAIGGVPSMGEESLMGEHVNFVFRMEKLSGSLGIPILVSAAARLNLGSRVELDSIGSYELKGFEGQYDFST